MKKLFVLPFAPSSNADQAGHRLAFDIIKNDSLSSDISLLLLLNNDCEVSNELYSLCEGRISKIIVGRLATFLSWVLGGGWVYPRFCTRFSKGALNDFFRYLALNKFDCIRFEFSQTFLFGYFLRKRKDISSSRILFSIHDLQLQVVFRREGWEHFFCGWAGRSEKEILKSADEIILLSKKDEVIVQSVLDVSVPVIVQNPILSPFVYKLAAIESDKREPNTLLFWGAMGRAENERAIIDFIELIFNKLVKNNFLYKLYVVGSSPSQKMLSYSSEIIKVTGFLDDPSEYFLKASIGVVPLKMGAGVKLKTLEMLEAGVPLVISTPVGAEGVSDCVNRLLVKDFDDFYAELAVRYKK